MADCVLSGKFPGAPKINLPAPTDRYFCCEQETGCVSSSPRAVQIQIRLEFLYLIMSPYLLVLYPSEINSNTIVLSEDNDDIDMLIGEIAVQAMKTKHV